MEVTDVVDLYIKYEKKPRDVNGFSIMDEETIKNIWRQCINLSHMAALMRNDPSFDSTSSNIKTNSPFTSINQYGYVYIYPSHLDKDGDLEHLSRSNMYSFLSVLMYYIDVKPKGWVIDLRNNPGGVIEYFLTLAAIIMNQNNGSKAVIKGINSKGEVNAIISIGKLITVTIDEVLIFKVAVPFRLKEPLKNVNIIMNNNTASAAEIFTILLRDNIGAKVYGERSHGVVSLMQSTVYQGYTFIYPVSKLMFDNGADYIEPDVHGIPDEFYPKPYADPSLYPRPKEKE